MFEEIIVAGAGGQGVLILGEVLAIAAIVSENKATWLPSYGPEMRGGTANCSVVISSDEVGSPMVEEPTLLVCFNQPSIAKFGPLAASGAWIFANDDAIEEYPEFASGVNVLKLKAGSLAAGLGNARAINMVMLGAILAKKPVVDYDSCIAALKEIWGPQKAEKLLPLNVKAIHIGMEAAAKSA